MKNVKKYNELFSRTDAVLLTGAANRAYAAEYAIAEGIALLTKEENFYFTDSRYIETAEKNLPDFTVLEVNREHPYSARINDALGKHGAKSVGFEENEMTYGEYLTFSQKLDAMLVPSQKQIDRPRSQKEPWELERMRKAQSITDSAFSEMLSVIRAGMTEKELAAELISALYRGGADGLAFEPIVVSGANTSLPHGVPSEKRIEYGDFITMDFGAVYQGYCSDMTRTVALGFVSEEMKTVYDTVLSAQETAISGTKAGMTGRELDALARGVIEKAGYGDYFGHSYGHSLGLYIHESPNASPSNEDALPVGAVISAEPGIYLPGKFGVRIEDVVVIGEKNTENLTKSPKNLIIL